MNDKHISQLCHAAALDDSVVCIKVNFIFDISIFMQYTETDSVHSTFLKGKIVFIDKTN